MTRALHAIRVLEPPLIIASPFYPKPSRKDGLFAEDPKGGDRGDRELRFSKRRCEIEPGTRESDLRRGARRAYGGGGVLALAG